MAAGAAFAHPRAADGDARVRPNFFNCVRALGMPGLPTRAVSSALPERPKAEGLWGHRDCMRISAHIWVGARCAWVSCERVYTDPWSRPRRARRARGRLRVSVQVRSRVIQSRIYLTQTQTAPARDLPVAARKVRALLGVSPPNRTCRVRVRPVAGGAEPQI